MRELSIFKPGISVSLLHYKSQEYPRTNAPVANQKNEKHVADVRQSLLHAAEVDLNLIV
jgi:hypothetical protein